MIHDAISTADLDRWRGAGTRRGCSKAGNAKHAQGRAEWRCDC